MNRALVASLVVMLLAWRVASRASEPEMRLSIAMEHSDGQPPYLDWKSAERKPHFHVLLTNNSDAPRYVRADEFVSFEVTDEFGKSQQIFQHLGIRGGSLRTHILTLNPGESRIFEIYYADRGMWGDGFWLPPEHPSGHITVRAMYESRPLDLPKVRFPFGKDHSVPGPPTVWEGRVTSPPVDCVIK